MSIGLSNLFNLRFEDRRKIWILGSVFLLAGISEMMNYTSFMAIFNSRVGTQYLPFMYLTEAFLLPLEAWLLSYFSQRLSKPRFMKSLYIFFFVVIVMNGIALHIFQLSGVDWIGFYVFLFLSSNFIVRQQTLLMWSTAFDLCPTQQAKRLMPIFVLCAIVGGIIAGVLSNRLALVLRPESLYLISGLFLLLGLPNFLSALKQYLLPLTFKVHEEVEQDNRASASSYLKETLRSPFLLTVIGIMTLMPAIYFLVEYQYFTSAQAVFTTEAELTSFYGLMVIILFSAAFLLQLFATKLINWLGASNTIIAITVVFFGSLVLVSVFIDGRYALIAIAASYSLVYLLLYYFAEPSYQFFFKMLPLDRRDGFRYTAQGIAASVGILLGSGLSMLHSEAGMSLTWQAIIGIGVTVILLGLTWIARHLYIKELVRYLQVGPTGVKDFLGDLLESMKNERVRRALFKQLQDPDQTVQRVAIELFASNPDIVATSSLLQYVKGNHGEHRALALTAIHSAGWRTMDEEIRHMLMNDQDEHVRAIFYRKLFDVTDLPSERQQWIDAARLDSSMIVQAEALRVMPESEILFENLRELLGKGGEAVLLACDVIGQRKLKDFFYDVMMCLLDPSQLIKITAVQTIGKIGGADGVTSLIDLLIGADKELKIAIEQAFTSVGEEGLPEIIRFMSSPNDEIWRAAVNAVNQIGSDKEIQELVVPSCVQRLLELCANQAYVDRIEAMGQDEWTELASKRSKEITASLLDTIWTVMIRFGDERTMPQLRLAVESEDEELRDHGLEILSEGIGHPKLTSALLIFYQNDQNGRQTNSSNADVIIEQVAVTDPWLQALAIKVGAVKGESELTHNWEYLSALDKIVFLKQVPLFNDISIEELGRIAGIAHEKIYEEGDFLMRQGETSQSLIMIVEGHVEVSGRIADGKEGTIGVVGPMQTIGEAGLFDDRPSNVSAQVLFEKAKVLEIAGEETARLVRLYPDIGVGLLRSISVRLRSMEQLVLKLG